MEFENAKELTKYLKTVLDLESSIYQQEASVGEANLSLYKNDPDIIYEDEKKQLDSERASITKPIDASHTYHFPVPHKAMASNVAIALLIFSVIAFLFWLVIAFKFGLKEAFTSSTSLIIFVAAIASLIVCIVSKLSGSKKEKERHARAVREYEYEVNKAKTAYEMDCERYKGLLAENDRKKEEALKKCEQDKNTKYSAAQAAVAKLSQTLSETKATLQSLYDLDVIFPKYRNFVAISTIYEYFASGRCTELTGPNGAYNLYESELRQNLIIGQLESIKNNLNQIKDNQYILYNEISNANRSIAEISQDVNQLLSVANSSKASLDIAAKCAEATQKNTEALKYLTLVNTAK